MGVSKESISKFLIGNRFPIKNLLIDSLLTPIVESTYIQRVLLLINSVYGRGLKHATRDAF